MEIRSRYLRASVVTPIIIMVLVTGYLLEAFRMAPPVAKGRLTESFYPILLSILMYPLCAKLLIDGIKESNRKQAERKFKIAVKPLTIAFITGLYIFAFANIGFIFTAPLYVFFFMLFFDDKPQQVLRKLIYALIITAVVYFLYEYVFDIHFPELWRG